MVWRWSKTAASNATADATINWAEGMPPSAVNDSARAEMARVAQYRDDIAGAIATTGTSSAYLVSSNQVFDTLAHMDGAMVAFAPHAGNAGTATINVDGLGAKPLRSAPSVELPAGFLVLGTPYAATYFNTAGEWILQGCFNNPFNVPLGGMIDYVGQSAPSSAFVLPVGQALSRVTYASLFGMVSTAFGAGDGSTTFNVPDLRGRAAIASDNMGGISASRMLGYLFAVAGGSQAVTLTTTTMPSHFHGGATGGMSANNPHTHTGPTIGFIGANGASATFNAWAQAGGTALGFPNSALADINHAHTIGAEGGNGAHANDQPSIAVSKILRVL